MLSVVKIQGEDDSVGFVDVVAAGACKEGAEPTVFGSMTHEDLVAGAFQE